MFRGRRKILHKRIRTKKKKSTISAGLKFHLSLISQQQEELTFASSSGRKIDIFNSSKKIVKPRRIFFSYTLPFFAEKYRAEKLDRPTQDGRRKPPNVLTQLYIASLTFPWTFEFVLGRNDDGKVFPMGLSGKKMTPSSELERLVGAGFYESHATFPGFVILAFILFCDGGKNKGRFIKAERAFVVFVAFFSASWTSSSRNGGDKRCQRINLSIRKDISDLF